VPAGAEGRRALHRAAGRAVREHRLLRAPAGGLREVPDLPGRPSLSPVLAACRPRGAADTGGTPRPAFPRGPVEGAARRADGSGGRPSAVPAPSAALAPSAVLAGRAAVVAEALRQVPGRLQQRL